MLIILKMDNYPGWYISLTLLMFYIFVDLYSCWHFTWCVIKFLSEFSIHQTINCLFFCFVFRPWNKGCVWASGRLEKNQREFALQGESGRCVRWRDGVLHHDQLALYYHLRHGCQPFHQHRIRKGFLPEHVCSNLGELLLRILILWLLPGVCWAVGAKPLSQRLLLQDPFGGVSRPPAHLVQDHDEWRPWFVYAPWQHTVPEPLHSALPERALHRMDYQHLRQAICGYPLPDLRLLFVHGMFTNQRRLQHN